MSQSLVKNLIHLVYSTKHRQPWILKSDRDDLFGGFGFTVNDLANSLPQTPVMIKDPKENGSEVILVGTLGKSHIIDGLVHDKKIYTQLDQTTAGLRDTVIKAQGGVTDFQDNMEALKKSFLLRGYFKNRGYDNSSDLVKYEIAKLPQSQPLKTFTFDAKQLFDKVDTAKPKNQKSLRAAGQYLADNEFRSEERRVGKECA